jgi:hypothetical protein
MDDECIMQVNNMSHNNSYRHFRRPLLFSAAYTWPPKISPYFRRLFQAAENSLIFGGV